MERSWSGPESSRRGAVAAIALATVAALTLASTVVPPTRLSAAPRLLAGADHPGRVGPATDIRKVRLPHGSAGRWQAGEEPLADSHGIFSRELAPIPHRAPRRRTAVAALRLGPVALAVAGAALAVALRAFRGRRPGAGSVATLSVAACTGTAFPRSPSSPSLPLKPTIWLPLRLSVSRLRLSAAAVSRMAEGRPKFFDIAANLTDSVFRGVSYKGTRLHADDFEAVVTRFQAVGGAKVLVSGTSYEKCVQAVELARQYPGMFYATVGVHPAHALEFPQSGDPAGHLAKLRRLLAESRDVVRAVGEVGLDYAELQECPKEVQLQYFEAQLALAEETGLPMFLHSRDCGLDFVEVVERHRNRFSTGVVHSFTGGTEELQRLLALGLSIGVNGASLRTEAQVKLAQTIPADRLMLETDAPWCDIRKGNFGYGDIQTQFETRKKEKFEMGKCVERRNEPCHVVQVFEVLAAHHPAGRADRAAFAAQLYANAQRMFLPEEEADGAQR